MEPPHQDPWGSPTSISSPRNDKPLKTTILAPRRFIVGSRRHFAWKRRDALTPYVLRPWRNFCIPMWGSRKGCKRVGGALWERDTQFNLSPLVAMSGSARMRGFAAGVGSKADIGARPLTQLSIMSRRPSGLYQLNCTPTTALRGFRLGARRAVVCVHHKRRATTSGSLATTPFGSLFPSPRSVGKACRWPRIAGTSPPTEETGKAIVWVHFS